MNSLKIDSIEKKISCVDMPPINAYEDIKFMPNDTIIVAAGFEDRSLAFINKFANYLNKTNKIIIIDYRPLIEHNHLQDIIKLCKMNELEYDIIIYDRHYPFDFSTFLTSALQNNSGDIYYDISGMSRLLIVQSIVTLHELNLFAKVKLLYAEAECYYPLKEEVDAAINILSEDTLYKPIFLSSGVYELVTPPELTTTALLGRPVRLVAFPGFNTDQFSVLNSEIQPHHLEIINGIPLEDKNNWRLEAIRTLNFIEKLKNRKTEYNLSTFDYKETLNILLKIYTENSIFDRIMIAPLGSKMQTVSVGIFRSFFKDIQIVYPVPSKFSEIPKYTTGYSNLYILDLAAFNI